MARPRPVVAGRNGTDQIIDQITGMEGFMDKRKKGKGAKKAPSPEKGKISEKKASEMVSVLDVPMAELFKGLESLSGREVSFRLATLDDFPETQQDDPWVGRSKLMKCPTCLYSVKKGESDLGRCRRHAPTMTGYPVIMATDWCGDHKLDENKVK